MQQYDFSQLTDAQLSSAISAYTSALSGGPLNAKRYKIGTREKENPSLTEIAAILSALNSEVADRANVTGGVGVVGFGEPE